MKKLNQSQILNIIIKSATISDFSLNGITYINIEVLIEEINKAYEKIQG